MPRKVTPKQRVAARDKSRANTLRKEIQALDKGSRQQGVRQPLLEFRESLKGKKISASGAAALGRKRKKAPAATKKSRPRKRY